MFISYTFMRVLSPIPTSLVIDAKILLFIYNVYTAIRTYAQKSLYQDEISFIIVSK